MRNYYKDNFEWQLENIAEMGWGSKEAYIKEVEETEEEFQKFLKTAEGKKWQEEERIRKSQIEKLKIKPVRRIILDTSGRTRTEYLRRHKR